MTYINYQDKLYYLYRKIKKKMLKNDEAKINLAKLWMCDNVITTIENDEEICQFVREIPEVEVLESDYN